MRHVFDAPLQFVGTRDDRFNSLAFQRPSTFRRSASERRDTCSWTSGGGALTEMGARRRSSAARPLPPASSSPSWTRPRATARRHLVSAPHRTSRWGHDGRDLDVVDGDGDGASIGGDAAGARVARASSR
jgi:hypothetical protein